jgi:TetR/AcrR family transcriptional regulator, repressor for uid operon
MVRTVNPVKLEARRREILDAAQACFEQKGFHATTMAEICAAAGISPGGLYRYFPSKEAIIGAMAEDERQSAASAFTAVSQSDNFLDALSQMCVRLIETYSQPRQAALMAELMAEALRNPGFAEVARHTQIRLRADLASVLRAGQASGQVDSTLDADEAAGILIAATDGLGLRMVFLGDFAPKEAAAALQSLVWRYLKPGADAPGNFPPPPGVSNDA